MRATATALAALALTGCATAPEPKIRTVEVRVPVAVSCVPKDTPEAPSSYPDDHLEAAPDAAERYRLSAAGSARKSERLAILEPILRACR